MNLALWIIQALLALLFFWTGGLKLVLPSEQLTGPIPLPVLFIRFIGLCEVLGAFGLILPWLSGIWRGLTPLAAGGLTAIMIGAIVINLLTGETVLAVFTFLVGLLTAFVAYGRWHLLPHRTSPDF